MDNYSRREASGRKRVAILGVTGYAGLELARLLLRHPAVVLAAAFTSGRPRGDGAATARPLAEIAPAVAGRSDLLCAPATPEAVQDSGAELVLLATPHEVSMDWAPKLLAAGARVVDLSGAFRLRAEQYPQWYGGPHAAPDLLAEAVYGWPERYAAAIASARLVSNPGCYALAAITALWPLVRGGVAADSAVICDAKSGASGAGKGLREDLQFVELEGNCKAYGVATHRHTPEIAAQSGLPLERLTFTPHLLPVSRGILATSYVPLRNGAAAADLETLYRDAYRDSPFVRVHADHLPEIKDVVHTNYCDVGFRVRPEAGQAIVVSCLDNLLKGAAGQAVENMNVMLGLPRESGLL